METLGIITQQNTFTKYDYDSLPLLKHLRYFSLNPGEHTDLRTPIFRNQGIFLHALSQGRSR